MDPSDRLNEAAKQSLIVGDDLAEIEAEGTDIPEGLAEEIYEISERLRRASHAIPEEVSHDV